MPQVLTHGLVAAGGVFLRVERSQVLGYFRQILATLVDSLCDCTEASTLCALIGGDRRRAVVGVRTFDVSTGAVRVGGCCLAVRTDQVIAVRVTVLFLRLRQRTLKILRLYCQGLTEQEISDKLKISQPTVHQYLARAIERLKAIKKRL